jgi:ubiquinone/menaquinone biosynthesis C-methylase UbiE
MNIETLITLATGYWSSAALSAAVELGVFECLATGAKSAEDTARSISGSREHTAGLLDTLAGLEILQKDHGRYSIHPDLLEVLDPASPRCLLDALRFNMDLYPVWGRLAEGVREGRPVIPPESHLGGDPGRTRRFVRGMHSRARLFAPAVLPAVRLEPGDRLLDVACGPGTFSTLLAEGDPRLHVTLYDLPPILDAARALQAGSTAADRLVYHPGDYHEDPLPEEFDNVFYCGALHQESPDQAATLLEKIYRALRTGGGFILVDFLLETDRTRPAFAALFSLNMMLTRPTGRVYSGNQAVDLVKKAGFNMPELVALTPTPYRMIRARKP